MANPGQNEGFHVLDDFVCKAIHAPGIPLAKPAHEGRSAGMSVVDEIVVDARSAGTNGHDEKENLARLLLSGIVYGRAVELGKSLPVNLDELDLQLPDGNALVSVVSRYLMAREVASLRPGEARAARLVDAAVLLAEVARPHSLFVTEARQTGLTVVERLMRYEGWCPLPSTASAWANRAMTVDPVDSRCARAYLGLLRLYWGWVGPSHSRREDGLAAVMQESVLSDLASRCT